MTDVFGQVREYLNRDHPTRPSRDDGDEPEVFYTDNGGVRWYFGNTVQEFMRFRNGLLASIPFFYGAFYFKWFWLCWLLGALMAYCLWRYIEYREPYFRVVKEFSHRRHDKSEALKRMPGLENVEVQHPHGGGNDNGVI